MWWLVSAEKKHHEAMKQNMQGRMSIVTTDTGLHSDRFHLLIPMMWYYPLHNRHLNFLAIVMLSASVSILFGEGQQGCQVFVRKSAQIITIKC